MPEGSAAIVDLQTRRSAIRRRSRARRRRFRRRARRVRRAGRPQRRRQVDAHACACRHANARQRRSHHRRRRAEPAIPAALAQSLGIRCVFQELSLCPNLTRRRERPHQPSRAEGLRLAPQGRRPHPRQARRDLSGPRHRRRRHRSRPVDRQAPDGRGGARLHRHRQAAAPGHPGRADLVARRPHAPASCWPSCAAPLPAASAPS